MNSRYFPKMLTLMTISVVLLALTTVAKLPPFTAIIAGIAPLAWYHLKFLVPKAKGGLSQAAVDSVYYFGFLVTVATLSISALVVGMGGDDVRVESIVFQFGTGLIATAYAVVARMHLQSLATHMSELSLDVIMDKYVTRSVELLSHIDVASVQLAAFSTDIVKRTIEGAEAARRSAEEKLLDIAETFATELKEVTSEAKTNIHEVRVLLDNTAFVGERLAYVQSVKQTLSVTADLNTALAELILKTKEETGTLQQAIQASATLSTSLHQFSAQIRGLGGQEGEIVQSVRSLGRANGVLAEASTAMAGTVEELREFADVVKDTVPAFGSVRTVAKRANEQLDALGAASDRLGSAIAHVSNAVQVSDLFGDDMQRLAAILPGLTTGVALLAANLEKAGTASASLEGELTRLPDQVNTIDGLGGRIAGSMTLISRKAEEAVVHFDKLAAQNESAGKVLAGTSRMLETAAGLQAPMASLHALFTQLGAAVATAQSTLVESAAHLNANIANAGHAVDGNIRHSAEASAQLVDQLRQASLILAKHAEAIGRSGELIPNNDSGPQAEAA